MVDRCVICGDIIPEGSEVCPVCRNKWITDEDSFREVKSRRIENTEKKGKRGDRRIVIQ